MLSNHFNFENFISNRLGFGKFHLLVVLSLVFVEITDGIQAITISLVTPILKQELELSPSQVSFFSAVFYLGVSLGVISAGFSSHRWGRKKCLLAGIIAQLFSGLCLSIKLSYTMLCVFRLLYGAGFGVTLTVATLIVTQSFPMQYRGKTLLVIFTFNSLGKLFGVGLAFQFLSDTQKQWSKYMLFSTLPCFIALILSWIYVKESYRYLLSVSRYEQAFNIIDQVLVGNGKISMLSEEQRGQIQRWSMDIFRKQDKRSIKVRLCAQKSKLLFLSFGWFFLATVAFGEMFIVPFMVSAGQKGLTQYFWMHLGELPSLLLAYPLIDREGFGRKKTLIIFFSASTAICWYVVFSINSFSLFLAKLIIKATFQMITPFTSESYGTRLRSIAFSINSLSGRLGATIMPFFMYPLFEWNADSPFMVLSLCSLLGAICIYQIKQDTLKKPLDDSCEEVESQLSEGQHGNKQFEMQTE